MTKLLAGLILAGVTMAAPAISQDAIENAVKARKATMQLYAFNLGVLGGMARGNTEYNAEVAAAAAKNLHLVSQQNNMLMWPEGSDNASIEGTNALPAIWENMDGVVTAAANMEQAAAAMEAAAGTDLASLQGAMGALGGACGGCHQNFRASTN